MSGFISVHRSILDHAVWTSCSHATFRLWSYCIIKANWKDGKMPDGSTVHRGSFVTSLGNLASATSLSVQQTRDSLENLRNLESLTYRGTSRYTIITITNYETYQSGRLVKNTPNNEHRTRQATSEEHAEEQQYNNKEEIKNNSIAPVGAEKRPRKASGLTKDQEPWFEAFWSAYWRKVKPSKAREVYARLVKTEEMAAAVLDAVRAQTPEMARRSPEMVPHPTSWLNAGCFEDEPASIPEILVDNSVKSRYHPGTIGLPKDYVDDEPY